jgi:hypothetical protein
MGSLRIFIGGGSGWKQQRQQQRQKTSEIQS